MRRNILLSSLAIAAAFFCMLCSDASARLIPQQFSNVEYFYIFGPEGDPLLGEEEHGFELFVDVPADAQSDVTIKVFDPDTGDRRDFRTSPSNDWDTRCEFAVYGEGLLDKKEFGQKVYDSRYYTFGPYPKTKGQKTGNYYRFKLTCKGISGDDANLFRVEVLPDNAEVFSELFTFRLLPRKEDKMYFYPQVPAGTEHIVVYNYDLDPNGGTAALEVCGENFLSRSGYAKYPINKSESGQWAQTKITLRCENTGRLRYVITKGTQKYAHAGIKIEDDKGNLIPIYFQPGKPAIIKPVIKQEPVREQPRIVPENKCNKFIFDATESYDIDKQKLSFLWDFGDGATATDPVVTHVYEKGGSYTVTLTVKDDSGLVCDTAAITQTVKVNTAPKAALEMPDSACAGDELLFDASATTDDTSDNITYAWDFGDGTKGEGERVKKEYEKGGTYRVMLTVNDNEDSPCSIDTIQKTIKINSPPVANAGNDIDICLDSFNQEYKVMLDGSASSDTDGDKLKYVWDLGDGSTAEGAKVAHIYSKPGKYNVMLTVDDGTDTECSQSSDTIAVILNKAPKADIYTKDSRICVGDEVIFDGSGSATESGEHLSYVWDFGDGTEGEGIKTTHVYTKGGKYYPRLTVDDGSGTRCSKAIASAEVDVNSRPVASLKGDDVVCFQKAAAFDASASYDEDGNSLKYYWDFGDGAKQEGPSKVSHAYAKGGTYTVTVTVDDSRGYVCSSSSDSVSVRVNAKPIANAGPNTACCVDEETFFDGSASSDPDGDGLTYEWDFGDGSTGRGAKVSHVYTKPGNYKVVLTVDDGSDTECSKDSSSFMANVNASPVAIIKVR